MRRNIQRATEWLASHPWALVGLVTLVVVVPILLLGELSAAEMQRRLRAERLALGAQAADRGAEEIQTQLSRALLRLRGLARGAPDLIPAIQLGDQAGIRGSLTYPEFAGGLTDIQAIDVADPTGRVLATVSPVSGFSGGTAVPAVGSLADREYFRTARAGTATIAGLTTDSLYIDHPVVIAAPLYPVGASDNAGALVGVLVGEIRGEDLVRHLRSAELGPFADLYILDGGGWLIGRAAAPGTAPVNLRGDAIVRQLLAGGRLGAELRDPVTGTTGLLNSGTVVVEGGRPWTVVIVQAAGGVEAETAGTLADQRALRLALVGILLLGSFAFARIAARSLKRREQLTAALAEVEAKRREVETANRHKSEFLANMSHELRTPLNAIIGFSEVLSQQMFGSVNDKQGEYLGDIQSSGQHLLSLINDILDLSKVEAGKMELQLSSFSLDDALRAVLLMVRERANARDIALSSDVAANVGTIEADERKVKQIVLNLLTNALKFTPSGGRVDLRAARDGGGVTVAVRDTGGGIAPADQARIFEEFAQAHDGAAGHEGTGLGLTLSRKFVELHGGAIWVESALGRGSTFTFTLPAVASALR
jgi:signal transduction histidine kinase